MEKTEQFSSIFSTEVKKAAIISTASWLLVTIVVYAFLNGIARFGLLAVCVVVFIILPAINHVRMFLAIRSHNSQTVGQVGAQQLSVIFRREKKVAADMVIVVMVLVACLGPILGVNIKFSLPPNSQPSLPLGIYDDASQFIDKSYSLLDT